MSATVAQLRLLLNDPDDGDTLLTDAQYTVIIGIEENIYRAAALGAKTIAALFAEKVKWTAGPISLDNQQKFDHYLALAELFDSRAKAGGGWEGGVLTPYLEGVSEDRMETFREDTDRVQPAFRIKMHDNPPLNNTDDEQYVYDD